MRHAVPGEGSERARVIIVGEQPGDQEDRAGRPFVGPAGDLVDAALQRLGLGRGEVYVTNVFKHSAGRSGEGDASNDEHKAAYERFVSDLSMIRKALT